MRFVYERGECRYRLVLYIEMILKNLFRPSKAKIACKQALRMGYSEICFRIARGRALLLARPLAIRKQISE